LTKSLNLNQELMKKKLLNLAFVIVASVNAVVFFSFTDATNGCGSSGTTVNAKIRVQLPSSLGSTYEHGDDCTDAGGSNGGNPLDFSFHNLTYYNEWYMTIHVSYDGGTNLYNYKYGQLPGSNGIGIRTFNVSGCTDLGFANSGSAECNLFPVQFKTENVNVITVRIYTPCGQINNSLRSVATMTRTFQANTGYSGNTFLINTVSSVGHLVTCNPC